MARLWRTVIAFMPTFRTHYDTLKVSKDAPIEVIQAAYRSLARKYHPDRAGTSAEGEAIMKAINAAYEVLSNPTERAKYDRWVASQTAGGRSTYPDPRDTTDVKPGGAGGERVSPAAVLLAICYLAAAVFLLRFPGPPRMIGITMLVAGWGILQVRRSRKNR
jgi:hypothetical protein